MAGPAARLDENNARAHQHRRDEHDHQCRGERPRGEREQRQPGRGESCHEQHTSQQVTDDSHAVTVADGDAAQRVRMGVAVVSYRPVSSAISTMRSRFSRALALRRGRSRPGDRPSGPTSVVVGSRSSLNAARWRNGCRLKSGCSLFLYTRTENTPRLKPYREERVPISNETPWTA